MGSRKTNEKFTYLGGMASKGGGSNRDTATRIGKATAAFICLSQAWRSRVMSRKTKLRIFTTNVKSVLLYGFET